MQKTAKRAISLAAAFVILLSSVFSASALTEGSTYSFTTGYTSVYYNFGSYRTANGEYHSANGQLALRTLKSTGEPIYCLQAHKSTDGDKAKALPLSQTAAWDIELSDGQKIGITWASIYGYRGNGINKYGYSAEAAQIATQMLIWEWQTTRRTNLTAAASSYVTNAISGNNLACYYKILEACRNHNSNVKFDKSSVTLKGVGEAYAQYFTDQNGQLSNFEISKNSNSSVVGASISGNKLKVWAKSATKVSANIQLTKKMTNIGSSMCLTGAGQTMFYGAVSDPVNTNISVNVEATATVKMRKLINTTVPDTWTAQEKAAAQGTYHLDLDYSNNDNISADPATVFKTGATGYTDIMDGSAWSHAVTANVVKDNAYQVSNWKTITGLKPGWYRIREVETENNYTYQNKNLPFSVHKGASKSKLISSPYNNGKSYNCLAFYVAAGAEVEISVNNVLKTANLKLRKTLNEPLADVPNADAETARRFELTVSHSTTPGITENTAPENAFGVTDGKATYIDLEVGGRWKFPLTVADGETDSPWQTFQKLAPGWYRIREINNGNAYSDLDPQMSAIAGVTNYKWVNSPFNESGKIVYHKCLVFYLPASAAAEFGIKNNIKTANFQIKKVTDTVADTGRYYTFCIQQQKNGEWSDFDSAASVIIDAGDSEGVGRKYENVTATKYRIRETEMPDSEFCDYGADGSWTADENGVKWFEFTPSRSNEVLEIKIHNKQKGKLKLTTAVNGALSVDTDETFYFKVMAAEDIPNTNIKAGDVIADNIPVAVTNGQPNTVLIADNLYPGKYTVSEYSTSGWYAEDPKTVTVTAGETATVEFTNTLKTVRFCITKIDEISRKQLQGAEFTVYTTAGEPAEQYQPQTTGEDGTVEFVFAKGEYMIIETKAPAGYELSMSRWIISIDPDKGDNAVTIDTETAAGAEPTQMELINIDSSDVCNIIAKYSVANTPTPTVMTGGIGVLPFVLGGGSLLVFSAVTAAVYFLIKKKGMNKYENL